MTKTESQRERIREAKSESNYWTVCKKCGKYININWAYEQGKKDGEKLRKELEEKLKRACEEIFSLDKELRETSKDEK